MALEKLLGRFAEIADNPNAYIIEWKKKGGKAIGAMPPFPPEEVIYAAGALPVGLWGGNVVPTDAYQYFPTFYCSILTTTLQLAMQGSYRELSAFVCGTGCDGLQDMMEDWKLAVPSIPMIDCIYPQRRDIEASRLYMVDELEQCSERIQAITGHKTTDIDLQHAIRTYNDRRAAMREFSAVACDHLDIITPTIRHNIYKSAHVMDCKEHLQLLNELLAEMKARPVHDFKGTRLVTTGIIIDAPDLLKMLEENKIAVVGDDLISESKRHETDVPNGIDLYYQLAVQWCSREGSCILQDHQKKRAPMLVELAKQRKADGVLTCSLKFCEPDAYDYPILRRVVSEAGLPELHLEIENVFANDQQAATRIEAFREMIGK